MLDSSLSKSLNDFRIFSIIDHVLHEDIFDDIWHSNEPSKTLYIFQYIYHRGNHEVAKDDFLAKGEFF